MLFRSGSEPCQVPHRDDECSTGDSGLGKLPGPLVKVSGRAPQTLVAMIEKGTRLPLSRILPEACERLGGFGDGHSVAASGVFPVGREDSFVEEIDRLASGER